MNENNILEMPLMEVLEELQKEESAFGKTALIRAMPTLFIKANPTLGDLIKIPMKKIADMEGVELSLIRGLVMFITKNGISCRWCWKTLTTVRRGSKKKSFKFPTTTLDHRLAAARSHGMYENFRRFREKSLALA